MEKGNIMMSVKSRKVIGAPPYKARMFVKKHKNQLILKDAYENSLWPNFENAVRNDIGMNKVKEIIENLPISMKIKSLAKVSKTFSENLLSKHLQQAFSR